MKYNNMTEPNVDNNVPQLEEDSRMIEVSDLVEETPATPEASTDDNVVVVGEDDSNKVEEVQNSEENQVATQEQVASVEQSPRNI